MPRLRIVLVVLLLTLPAAGRASADSTRAAEANFRVADLALELAWIKPGSFAMGSPRAGDGDERPVTRVTLSAGFWLGVTEVTQAQWTAVMGKNPSAHRGNRRTIGTMAERQIDEFAAPALGGARAHRSDGGCRRVAKREQALRDLCQLNPPHGRSGKKRVIRIRLHHART